MAGSLLRRRLLPAAAIGGSIGGLASYLSVSDVKRVSPPPTLRRIASERWDLSSSENGDPAGAVNPDPAATGGAEEPREEPTPSTYFYCFSAPAEKIVDSMGEAPGCGGKCMSMSDEVRKADGADLARALFTSRIFLSEKLLFTAIGPFLARRGVPGWSGLDLPDRFERGSSYMWWTLVDYNENEAVLSVDLLSGLLYVGRSGDGQWVSVGTAVAPKGPARGDTDVWGSTLDNPDSWLLTVTHHFYTRLLAKSTAHRVAQMMDEAEEAEKK